MAANTVSLPAFSDGVDLRYFMEALGGPSHPRNALDRFPEALYNKSPDSHFVRFMYVLLGPVGVAWLKASLIKARLALEASGAQLFDLERFYGDPFRFGRILEEYYDQDITGLLPQSLWNQIRVEDEAYRSRAIQFMNAARLGTTPKGMQLAASSGIGENAAVFENYRYLFDNHSDDILGLRYVGQTGGLGEFIVVPRPAVSRTEIHTIDFQNASLPLGTNVFTVTFNGYVATFAPTVDAITMQSALQALPTIGAGNVLVSGGPAPDTLVLTFSGALSNQRLPKTDVDFLDTSSDATVEVPVVVSWGVLDSAEETVVVSPDGMHAMQVALDYLRPVASFPTFNSGRSLHRRQVWNSVTSSSEHVKVIRFVTGSSAVNWPPVDNIHWIQNSAEAEAPQRSESLQQYVGWHNIANITAYTDDALLDHNYNQRLDILSAYNSIHVGGFPEESQNIPFLAQYANSNVVFTADRGLADYAEPLSVSAQPETGALFINGTYPADYVSLQGVPPVKYREGHFWASRDRTGGADILEIDLGSVQAVNYLTFETIHKPINIEIDYDLLDQAPARRFTPVTPRPGLPYQAKIFFDPSAANPWEYLEYLFNDGRDVIFTRFIRLTFTRRADSNRNRKFLFNYSTHVQNPWTINIRNLRVGRNVAPTVV